MIDVMKLVSTVPFRLAMSPALVSFMIAVTNISCDNSRVHEENHEFADHTWKVIEEPRFEFMVRDTSQRYNLYYNVRNSLDYKWQRIFVTFHLYDSSGRELSKKLVYHDLFEKTGRPLGDSGIGDLFDHQFLLMKDYRFGFSGRYSVKLDQLMRQDTLQGIIAVGVRVEKAADQ